MTLSIDHRDDHAGHMKNLPCPVGLLSAAGLGAVVGAGLILEVLHEQPLAGFHFIMAAEIGLTAG